MIILEKRGSVASLIGRGKNQLMRPTNIIGRKRKFHGRSVIPLAERAVWKREAWLPGNESLARSFAACEWDLNARLKFQKDILVKLLRIWLKLLSLNSSCSFPVNVVSAKVTTLPRGCNNIYTFRIECVLPNTSRNCQAIEVRPVVSACKISRYEEKEKCRKRLMSQS